MCIGRGYPKGAAYPSNEADKVDSTEDDNEGQRVEASER